jgi:hypothetical protein
MTSFDVNIEGLDELVDRSLTRFIDEIDPTLNKFFNISTQLLSTFKTRVKENVSDTLYSLETNLFVLLFVMVIFIILLLIMFWLLESVMKNFGFTLGTRKFIGLTLFTIVFVWLFVTTILVTFPPEQPISLQTLKYVLFGVLCAGAVIILFIWIRYICVHSKSIMKFFTDELFNFKPKINRIEAPTVINATMVGMPLNPIPYHPDQTKF